MTDTICLVKWVYITKIVEACGLIFIHFLWTYYQVTMTWLCWLRLEWSVTYWTMYLLIRGILSSDVIAIDPVLVNVMAGSSICWVAQLITTYVRLTVTPFEDLFKRWELVVITLPGATDNKRHLISWVYISNNSLHATYELLYV